MCEGHVHIKQRKKRLSLDTEFFFLNEDTLAKTLHKTYGWYGSIPGLGRSPEGGHGNLLQYSCLGNPMDRGAWWLIVHGGHRVRHTLAAQQQQQGIPMTTPEVLGLLNYLTPSLHA